INRWIHRLLPQTQLSIIAQKFIGEFPTRETIDSALSNALNENALLSESNWHPDQLFHIVENVRQRKGLNDSDLGQNQMESRILGHLKDGSRYFQVALKDGIDSYVSGIKRHLSTPQEAWRYLLVFSGPIRQFGPTLAADYLKNIGFHQFVKPDYHYLRQFPELMRIPQKLDPKSQFVLGWELSQKLGVTAFYLDHLLYQWGRYGEVLNKQLKRTTQPSRFVGEASKPSIRKPTPSKTVLYSESKTDSPRQAIPPNSIWSVIYSCKPLTEVKKVNPFASKDWLKNTAHFSDKRRNAVDDLFSGKDSVTLAEIRNRTKELGHNWGSYPAFRAISHCLAIWDSTHAGLVRI
ncbi:hypothetical protein ACFL0Q_09460, partial [Thermodesulfobacteriota bacterium]